MQNLNFTALDFETANPSRSSICQIGICKVENGEIVLKEEHLIRPPDNHYELWNVNIHGICAEDTEGKPCFLDVWDYIKPYIEYNLLVAHNAAFDIDCLVQTLDYYKLTLPAFTYKCTYSSTGLTLIDLAEALDIPVGNHHNALEDAVLCAEAYIKLTNGQKPDLRKISPKNSNSLFKGHDRLSGTVLKPDLENADPDSPFYGKKVVFTGVLTEIERKEAARIVKEMGADIDTGITKRINYVIVGRAAGPSKLSKIKKYNDAGCDIKIIKEAEFLEMIKAHIKMD